MKENNLGNLFVRHLVMAIPWGLVILVVLFISVVGAKQQIKEGIEYAVKTSIHEAANLAYSYSVVVPVKKNVKEGIEFVAKTTKKEIKSLLKDPEIKQDIKEALEYSGDKLKK